MWITCATRSKNYPAHGSDSHRRRHHRGPQPLDHNRELQRLRPTLRIQRRRVDARYITGIEQGVRYCTFGTMRLVDQLPRCGRMGTDHRAVQSVQTTTCIRKVLQVISRSASAIRTYFPHEWLFLKVAS